MDAKHPSGNFDALLSADQELERMAVQRAEQEDEPRMPESPEEMIVATLEPTTGSVDRIIPVLSRLAVGNVSGLQDILVQINARLLAYLKSEATVKKKKVLIPSVYARQCFSASSGAASADEVVVIADITSHIIAELNPLVHAAWFAYSTLTKDMPRDEMAREGIPQTIEEFFVVFDQGRVEEQRVFSFFGVLKKIASEQQAVAFLDQKTAELPKEIVLTDPLGVLQKEYWTSRQRAYSAMGNGGVSLQTLVSGRTLLALNNFAELALSTRDEELKEAAEHISFWLEGERMQVEGLSDEAFEKYTAGLHFGYGDSEILLTLLNSLEIVKQKAPELYVRIMGRAPRPLIPTDARSDLFGNLLHAALFRSLHMESGKGTEGYQILQSFLTGLTHMDSHQALIAPLSKEEIEAIGKVIERDVKSGSFMAVAMAPMMFKEGRDAYMLGKLLEKVSAENREGLLQELRNATPDEFVRLMNSKRLFSRGLDWHREHDFEPDVKNILGRRGIGVDNFETRQDLIVAIQSATPVATIQHRARAILSLGVAMAIPTPTEDVQVRANYLRRTQRGREIWNRLFDILWKTTPSEKLLAGDEFYDYLKGAADALVELQGKFEKGIKKYEKKGLVIDKTIPIQDHPSGTLVWLPALDGGAPYEVRYEDLKTIDKQLAQTKRTLTDILNAHADITGLQWHRWLHGLQWESQGNGLEVRRKKLSEVKSVLAPIFHNSFSLIQISEGQSHFLQLFERLYPKATKMVERNLMNITDVVPASYYAWLESEKDSISPRSRAAVDPRELFAFQDVNYDKELNDYQELHMKNLLTLSKLFSPKTLADILKAYFVDNPGSVDLFCDMLSKEEREAFLAQMCGNAPGSLHAEWSSQQREIRVRMPEQYLTDSNIPRNAQQVTLLFSILKASANAIPDDEEYLNLKKFVAKHGYQSNQKSGENRRIQYREGEGWILEEGKRKLPAVGDVLSKQEMKKLLSSELEWREIARG